MSLGIKTTGIDQSARCTQAQMQLPTFARVHMQTGARRCSAKVVVPGDLHRLTTQVRGKVGFCIQA